MSSYRTDHDSWPYNGTRRQAEEDARFNQQPDRDLYNRHGNDQQRAYREEYDREQRRIEDQRDEERREEERQERQRQERREEMQRQEWAQEEQ